MVETIVGTGFQIHDVATKQYGYPDVTLALNAGTLLACSLGFTSGVAALILSFTGIGFSILGLVFYATNGILNWKKNSFGSGSVELVVFEGCDGLQNTLLGEIKCTQVEFMQHLQKHTASDYISLISWYIGFLVMVIWCGIHFLGSIGRWKSQRESTVKKTLWCVGNTVVLAGILIVIAAVLNTRRYTTGFIDCSQAYSVDGGFGGCTQANITLPGSPSGFWAAWAADKARVARSLFIS
ncbi:MAG: hypothetical protein M1813_009193 [Trichoglossum hirsutum]|nr:MAG: hypothetical protein M1813_009193 [Trichoglossum hirsutum]